MHTKKRLVWIGLILALVIGVFGVGCSSDDSDSNAKSSQEKAQDTANNRENYEPVNDVEGNNYNARLRLADNPSTLIWCSAYPTNPNVKPFTVPIVGKLTSGNKRPYPTQVVKAYENNGSYNPELPGPDGFFGSSGEYRYGFDPAGNYQDFYNMETYCTSSPTVIQKNTTQINISVQGDLNTADKKAEAALKTCQAKTKDPSVRCDAAAKALGVG